MVSNGYRWRRYDNPIPSNTNMSQCTQKCKWCSRGTCPVDVTKCHACHAKWRSMSPSATPATPKAAAPTASTETQARHQSQPSAISGTPAACHAKWSERRCQVVWGQGVCAFVCGEVVCEQVVWEQVVCKQVVWRQVVSEQVVWWQVVCEQVVWWQVMCEQFVWWQVVGKVSVDVKLCEDKLCVCVSNLCDDKFWEKWASMSSCVRTSCVCVSKLCDDKLCVSKLKCDDKGRRRREEAADGITTSRYSWAVAAIPAGPRHPHGFPCSSKLNTLTKCCNAAGGGRPQMVEKCWKILIPWIRWPIPGPRGGEYPYCVLPLWWFICFGR